jgi:protein kinase C substrate 80K-H
MLRLIVATLLFGRAATFACDGRDLPAAYVNDGYCDCEADRSDEPETGACPDTLFRCANRPGAPTTIFSSRVNDGVCDCCDGADEFRSKSCPNTCVEEAGKGLAALERSCARKAELSREGAAAAAKQEARLREAREQVAKAEPNLLALHAKREAAEAAEERRRADRDRRLAAGEVEAALGLRELQPAELGRALARLALGGGIEGVDALYDALDAHEGAKEAMDDVDNADLIEVAMEARDAAREAGGGGGGGGTSPNPDAADAAAGACEAHGTCEYEAKLLELMPLHTLPPPVARDVLLSLYASSAADARRLGHVSAALLHPRGKALDAAAVEAAVALLDGFADADADAARAALEAQQAAVAGAKASVEELAPIEALRAQLAFGGAHEWFHLHAGQCLELFEAPFRYKLCPFGVFEQDGRSLGKFKAWATPDRPAVDAAAATEAAKAGLLTSTAMGFDGGDECNGAPRRATALFACGEEAALKTVAEPLTCVYVAVVTTPAACDVEELRRLHHALAEAARAEGLEYRASEQLLALLG